MKVLGESGVLHRSERFFSTPSAMARHLFFYITRCGHYYYDENYNFVDSCEIGRLDSHKNYFLLFVRAGAMHFQTGAADFAAEQGQLALVDCRRPHHFRSLGNAEALWIHFDGANAGDFFEQIIAFRGGKQVFNPPAGYPIEQELAQIISDLSSGAMTEIDCSQRIYHILCALLFPLQPLVKGSQPITQAVCFINEHLFESISVSNIAAAVNLSPSHFSRLFRSSTGFSPHEYIVLHRIDHAKTLLYSTSLSIKEIAYQVGYHSEVNFITSFTNKVGVSPASFRQNSL